LDEPFAGVDIKTEKQIISVLKQLRDDGKTIIVVHHDLSTIKEYFDEVALININVLAQGSVDKVLTAENIEKTYKQRHYLDLLEANNVE
jgi:manganese/zinc/iron transport system ATP- binding protein